MKTLYFDCFAGASGNMILGALIDAGVDAEDLRKELKKLKLPDFSFNVENVNRSGISAKHVSIKIPDEKKHRHLPEIIAIISDSELSAATKEKSVAIFRRLAEAEAKVHGIKIEKVHFHEVGALDAIIDIVGSCIGFEILGIERFVCSKIHVGSGFVDMAHGKFPVPPPAVTELLVNAEIYSTEITGELITPTGAAIISTLCSSYGNLPDIKVEVTSYGAGSRIYENFPNVLRLIIGETSQYDTNENLIVLETNIDDMAPQINGFVMERAFELGALDCWFTPVQMKKNRPAVMLSVLCDAGTKERLTEMIYTETTTIGIRSYQVGRRCLEREMVMAATEYGDVTIKIARLNGRIVNAMPEYEEVRRIALEKDVAFRIVSEAALAKLNVHRKSAEL